MMITVYDHFPENPPEYELFMVVLPPRDEVLINWPHSDSTNWLSAKSGGSQFIQGATQFSTQHPFSLASIILPIRSMKPGSPGFSAVRVELRQGAVDGALLATAQIADFDSAAQYVEKEFSFPSAVSLSDGVAYWLVVILPSVSGGECLYQLPVKPGPNCKYRLSQSGAWVDGSGQVPLRLIKA